MDNSKMQTFKENEILVHEGDKSSGLYKIVSGKVLRYINYGKEDEYLVGAISEGGYFGEVAFLTGKEYGYTVVAFTEVLVMLVTDDDLEYFVCSYPTNAIDIMRQMAKNFHTLEKHVNMMMDEISTLAHSEEVSGIQLRKELKEDLLMYRKRWLENSEKADELLLSSIYKS